MTTPLKSRLMEEFEKKLNGPWSLMLGDSLAIAQSKRAFLAGAHTALLLAAEEAEKSCENCGGQGFTVTTASVHGCDGTEESCDATCPVPEAQQEQCEICARFFFPLAHSLKKLAEELK